MTTNDLIGMAHAILDLADERDRYRLEAMHYKAMAEEYMAHVNESIKSSEETFGKVFIALLDPNSNFNRAQAALTREEAQKGS